MRWTKRRVNRMRLTKWRRKLLQRLSRFQPSRSKNESNNNSSFVVDKDDSLAFQVRHEFSTRDQDNDVALESCAVTYKWACDWHTSNLNGLYRLYLMRGNHIYIARWRRDVGLVDRPILTEIHGDEDQSVLICRWTRSLLIAVRLKASTLTPAACNVVYPSGGFGILTTGTNYTQT